MKKITAVDATKLSKHIDSLPLNKLSVITMLQTINCGKNKYEEQDLIEYLVTFVYNKLNSKMAISNNKLEKILSVIKIELQIDNELDIYLGDELIEKLANINISYINNRNNTGIEGSTELVDLLDNLVDLVNKNKECKDKEGKTDIRTSLEDKAKLLKELQNQPKEEKPVKEEIVVTTERIENTSRDSENLIAKLNARIDYLLQELTEQKVAFDESVKMSIQCQQDLASVNKKVEDYKTKLKNARKETKTVNKELETVRKETEKRIKNLDGFKELALKRETELLELNQKIESLKDNITVLENRCEDYVSRICEYKTTIINQNAIIEELNNNTSLHNNLDDFILSALFVSKLSLDEILKRACDSGFNITRQEALESLRRINNKVNVMPVVGMDKKYGIVSPAIRTNQRLNVPNNSRVLDILLIADHHYWGEENEEFIRYKLNSVYDYCINNNIKAIYSLGDLFDNKYFESGVNISNYNEAKRLIEGFDKILPFDANIKNFILGGNHDRSFLRYGIDPIEELAFYRDDVISLGYNDAFMIFGGSDIIGLHHEGVPREDRYPDLTVASENTSNNLKRTYENAHLNYAEKYFDFLGHFHSARLDTSYGYGVVPSVNVDRNSDGAWHVKFNINGDGKIDSMVIKSLVFGKEKVLRPAIEVPYRKIKK